MSSSDFGPGVNLEMTCGACPQQYEGTVDGLSAYFRLRHGFFTFTIAKPGENAIGCAREAMLYHKSGEVYGSDGSMSNAPGFIMEMVEEFRSWRSPASARPNGFLYNGKEFQSPHEVVLLYAEYARLLGDELRELAAWADNHGWKSSRYLEGKRLRERLGLEKKDAEGPDGQ